ncbi:hypothetical protein EVAR_80320_1 [Eumeta japonica]|uniref:Uncharacterized protein n=1 Tax=Eumeta variegata TaxID=151549 RepID=A0A4C1UB73_EUMVA|nr:hypothetical protein EVAR_80320_1 [Eumeta japonica]
MESAPAAVARRVRGRRAQAAAPREHTHGRSSDPPRHLIFNRLTEFVGRRPHRMIAFASRASLYFTVELEGACRDE